MFGAVPHLILFVLIHQSQIRVLAATSGPPLKPIGKIQCSTSSYSKSNAIFAQAMFAKSIIVTKPLSDLMDQISFVESIRHRLRLRRCDLGLQDSSVQHTEADLAELNLRLICGEEGFKTVTEFYNIFWNSNIEGYLDVWGISVIDCVDCILLGMADTWRRLVLPFKCQPWQCFRISRMCADTGLAFLSREQTQVCNCSACADTFFFQASRL